MPVGLWVVGSIVVGDIVGSIVVSVGIIVGMPVGLWVVGSIVVGDIVGSSVISVGIIVGMTGPRASPDAAVCPAARWLTGIDKITGATQAATAVRRVMLPPKIGSPPSVSVGGRSADSRSATWRRRASSSSRSSFLLFLSSLMELSNRW